MRVTMKRAGLAMASGPIKTGHEISIQNAFHDRAVQAVVDDKIGRIVVQAAIVRQDVF